jgi:hypothetical protein
VAKDASRAEVMRVGKSGEFFTFDEVLKKLHIDETRLKRLVSEGEIRAFREGDEMKFRRADVENLDGAGEVAGVIDLSAGDASETLTDDLIFDEGDDLDLTAADAGMATAEISSQDTLVDDEIGMSTEPLGIEPGDMTDIDDDEPVAAGAAGAMSARRRPRPAAQEKGPSDLIWAFVMAVTFVFLILGMIVTLGIRDSGTGVPPKVATQIAGTFGSGGK